jgi:hypothetical protein
MAAAAQVGGYPLAYISQFELSSLPRRSRRSSTGAGSSETVISTLALGRARGVCQGMVSAK